MAAPAPAEGLIALACASPIWAGALGAALGLGATGLGAAVAQRTHAAGLRTIPPPPRSVWMFQGLLPGLLSAFLAATLADPWLLGLALGMVWGYSTGELANHARSAWAWAAVMSEPGALEGWQALSVGVRGRMVVGQLAGPLFLLIIATLVSGQPAVLGLALGASMQVITVARAAAALTRSDAALTRASSSEPPPES